MTQCGTTSLATVVWVAPLVWKNMQALWVLQECCDLGREQSAIRS
jgi:hypothetical protein